MKYNKFINYYRPALQQKGDSSLDGTSQLYCSFSFFMAVALSIDKRVDALRREVLIEKRM